MKIGSISSQYFLSILRIIEDMGLSRDEVLTHIDLPEHKLFNPKNRVGQDRLVKTFDFASEKLGEPNVGLQIGYRFRVHTFTETGSVLALCGTLAEAVQINAHYQSLTETIGQSELQRRDDGTFLVWHEGFVDHNKFRHLTEMIFAGYATTTNWLSWGFEKGVEQIFLRHDPPNNFSGYELVFGGRVKFGAKENSVQFNPKAVDKILPTSNPEKLAYVRGRLDIIMHSFEEKSDISERVKIAIRDALKDHRLAFNTVSKTLNMSDRNLRRTLKDAGVNYRELVEFVRRDLCNAYMRDGRSLTEIAQSLGYNDQSAFTRAFKNWYGIAPSDYKPEEIRL